MKTWMAVSVCLGATMLALPVQAQSDPAPNACWDAVAREARGMLDAGRVARNSYSVAPLNNAETQVTGIGQADGRPFSYRCTYNTRNGAAYAVSLTPQGGGNPGRPDFGRGAGNGPDFGRGPGNGRGPGGNFGPDPINTGDARRAAEQTCYDATLDYAQRQNPTASNFKIFLSQNRFAQISNGEIRVTGQGEMRQVNRLRGTWDYGCTYNVRTGRVRDISLGRFIPNR